MLIACNTQVELLESSAIHTPLQCGLGRSRLLLPAGMCEAAHRGDLPAVFVHELSHARAGDVRWSFLLHLISIALWPHPLVWRTRKAHLAACELVADAVSADVLGDVAGYCRTLARIALRAQGSLTAAGIGMARPSSISRRLRALRKQIFRAPLDRRRAAGTVAVALLAVGALGVLRFAIAAPPTKPVVAKSDAARPAIPTASVDRPAAAAMRLLVLDPHGKPLSGAEVVATIQTDEKNLKPSRHYMTGVDGLAEIALPKTYSSVRLWVRKSAMAGMYAAWDQDELAVAQLPSSFTIRLESGTTASGRIVDEQGRPIAEVKVRVTLEDNPKPAKSDPRIRYNAALAEECVTDGEGRWRINDVPKDDTIRLRIAVNHLEYLSDRNPGELQQQTHITTAMLRHGTATLTLKRGIIVRGRVIDPAGKPIRGALVIDGYRYFLEPSPDMPSVFPTDADGRYRLHALPVVWPASLIVIAPGWAPQYRNVTLKAGLPPQDVQMQPGKPVRLHFVDTAGKPVPGVRVRIAGLSEDQQGSFGQSLIDAQGKTYHNRDLGISDRSDKNGLWECKWGDQVLVLTCIPDAASRLVPTGLIMYTVADRTVTLKPEFHIKGRVVDAATGKPIPVFSYSLGQRSEEVSGPDGQAVITYSSASIIGRDGQFDYPWEYRENWPSDERGAKEKVQFDYRPNLPQPAEAFRLRVEAIGYAPQNGPEFHVRDGADQEQEFRLKPSSPVSGRVVDAAGRPVANVRVAMWTGGVRFFYGNIEDKFYDCPNTRTDAAGRFVFANPGMQFALIAYSDAGFALARGPLGTQDVASITLRPWATIRGRVFSAGEPLKNAMVELDSIRFGGTGAYYDRPPPRIYTMLQTYSDAGGRFEFKRVPPIPLVLSCGDSQPDHLDPTMSPDQPTPVNSEHAAGRPEALSVENNSVKFSGGIIVDHPPPELPASRPNVAMEPKPGESIDLDYAGAGTAVITGKVKLPPHAPMPKDEGLRYSENQLIARATGIAPLREIADAGFDARKGWRRVWRITAEGETYRASLQHWWVFLSHDGKFRIFGVPPGEYDLAIDVTGQSSYGQLAQKVIRFTVTAEDAARGTRSLGEIPLDPPTIPKIGVVPVLRFERPDGTTSSLEDLHGHWTLVKFWAGWHREAGEYQALSQDLKKRHAGRDLVSLDLSLDSDRAHWQAALRRLNPPGQQGRIGAAGDGLVARLPEYWLLDPAGKLVERVGAAEELAAEMERWRKEEAEKSRRKPPDK